MESTDLSAANGNLTEYFVSYGGEENHELIMQTGSSASEGCDQSGNIYISTPPDICVEHVSVDKDGNLILQTSSKIDGNTHDQPKGIGSQDTNHIAEAVQPLYTSLPSTSEAFASENTFVAYKDTVFVEENNELSIDENGPANSNEKIFFLQPNVGENVNVMLANTINNNAELATLKQANENIVLNIITEDGQKLENIILAQNVAGTNIGQPLGVKPKPNLETFPLPDGLGRSSQQMLQSYSKSLKTGVSVDKSRGYSGRRKSGRGRGRGAYVTQPVLREFHMEKKFEMLSNFQDLVVTSKQSKIKPTTSVPAKSSASGSRSDMVRAVNTDQNTIILTRSQPQQSLLQHPKTSERPSAQTSNTTNESVKPLLAITASSMENAEMLTSAVSPVSQFLTRQPKTPVIPKLITTPVMMKTSELKGMSYTGLQQPVSLKGANVPQVSTRMNATTGAVQRATSQCKTETARKGSGQMSTIVVIVPPCSKWGTSASDVDAKEKPLLENPAIMFSQNSSSSRTMLYEIPAKIVKFQEDKPLQRKLPFRHQDYLKVTKIQNEGEPIRPPGRFYKSRGSKKSIQISIPVVEKLSDGKGTKIISSVQQLMSMYPLLSARLPQIAKLIDSSQLNIPQAILGTEAVKSEVRTSQEIKSGILQDNSCTTMDIKSSLQPSPESSLSSYQKLELQVTDEKANNLSKELANVQHSGKELKGSTASQTPDNAPSFCHSNVLRTYQELRSISQKARSGSPFKMDTKNVKQNYHISSSLISTSGISGIVATEENSKATNIETSQTVQVERQNELHNMKSLVLKSVLKGLEVASPPSSNDSRISATRSCTSKSEIQNHDNAIEQNYCHEKLLGTISHKENVFSKSLECIPNSKSADTSSVSVLPDPYLNKQHLQTSIIESSEAVLEKSATTLNIQNADANLMDSTQHKTEDTDVISDDTFQKEAKLQLLPHSQNETNTENDIQRDPSSVNIDSLLTSQTALSTKYHVQTSLARNLSAGLKTLDLDSFLALSTDDDEMGRDGSLISKEMCQDSISKHEELTVIHSLSKNEILCRAVEHFPEGALYIEESPSSEVPMKKKLTEELCDSGVQLEESSGVTCDISPHTKELNIHSESGMVCNMSNTSDDRKVAINEIQSSACMMNGIEHEALETKSIHALNTKNVVGLHITSADSSQELKILSHENMQETVFQMQDMSKHSHLVNMNGSELATCITKSSEEPEQIEVSGCNTEAIEEQVKLSPTTLLNDKPNKETTVSSEHRHDKQKIMFFHDSLDESNLLDMPNTQNNTSLQCSDKPKVTLANITTGHIVPDINKKTEGAIASLQTGLQRPSGAASCQEANENLATSEQKANETCMSNMLTMNTSDQQPCTNVRIENVGNNYEAEKSENHKHVSICSSNQSFQNDTILNKGDNTVVESELKNKLPSEISDLRLTADNGFRKEILQSNSVNGKTCCLTSSTSNSDEDGIIEHAEEKLQNTSSLENKIESEVHFTKADNSSLLDEVTAVQKQSPLPGSVLTCSGLEIGSEISNIATGLDKISSNTVTEAEHSSINNGGSANLKMSSHYDKSGKLEEHFMKTDETLERIPSLILEESYPLQDDSIRTSRTEAETSSYSVLDNAKLDAPLYTYNAESKMLPSQNDKQALKVSTVFSAHESPELSKPTSDVSKIEVLEPSFDLAQDPHTVKLQSATNRASTTSSCASSDVESDNKTPTSDSANPVLKRAATTDLIRRATDGQPEESDVAAISKSTDFIFQEEKEHSNAMLISGKAEHPEISEYPDREGIPISSVINNSTNDKKNTSDVKNGTLTCIGSSIPSKKYSDVAPISQNVGILTGINVLATKETNSANMPGTNLSNINFINLLQPTKKMNLTGLSNSNLLGYANTLLLLPAINTQGSNVEYLNPAVTVRNELNVTEPSAPTDSLNSRNQIKNKNEIYMNFNTNCRNDSHDIYKTEKKTTESLQKCEKVNYQMSSFVFAGKESSLKEGQMILSAQTSEDTTNVSPGYALQNRAEKETESASECAAETVSQENTLFKVSNVETSNTGLNSGNMFALELLHGNNKEDHIVETAPSTSKQIGRERRRRKQSLEELRLPEEFMKMEVLPLQEESPVKKRRRYRKHSRTLAVDVKKELESSEQTLDYCGDTLDDVKLKKDENKELETDRNRPITFKKSESAENFNLSISHQAVSGNIESFSNEGSSIAKLKETSEEHLLISKTGENVKELECQDPQKCQAEIRNNNAVKKLKVEGEVVAPYPKKKLYLGSGDEENKVKESHVKEVVPSPQIKKLVDVDAEENGTHPKRRLFKQLSSEDLQKKDERKSKRILSKAKSLDHALLGREVSKRPVISELEHDQPSPTKVDGPGSSNSLEFATVSQSAKKLRGSYKKQSVEKVEEERDVENDNQEISSLKLNKTVKSSSPHLEQAVQCKVLDSKNKKGVSETSSQKQPSKIKDLKESIRRISRRSSVKHQLLKKDDIAGTSSKSIRASARSPFSTEKKEQRTARIIRELRKRMTPHYRRQGSSDSKLSAVLKKENFKTNANKQKSLKNTEIETKTNRDNTSLIEKPLTGTESQKKEKPEQDKIKLRRSARQYIKRKIIKIKMSLRMKNQGSYSDTALLSTRKRISSVEKLKKGVDSLANRKQKTRCEPNDRKKYPDKVTKPKTDKRKKFSTSGRKSLQTQRSGSPEYPIAVPVPQNTHCSETSEDCAQKDIKDVEARALDDKNTNETKVVGESEMNTASTEVRKECLQNEFELKPDVASLEKLAESYEKKPSNTEEGTKSFKEITVGINQKADVSLKADGITGFETNIICTEISRCKTDIDVKDTNVISADTGNMEMKTENIETDTNTSNKEATHTNKLDNHIVSSDVQDDGISEKVPNTNKDLTEGANSTEPKAVESEVEKLHTNHLATSAKKDTKLELPKKKFFKHREPGQLRNKKFTCIFNIEENEKELLETVTKSEKPATGALEGPIRDTEEYRIFGKRSLEMTDSHESATENVERPLQVESHMLDIGINLPEIPDITFIPPSERKWPLAAKEMKCYMGKRRRLLDDAEDEEEEEEEDVKEEPQEELEFQSSRWPETTRKRCYPGKRIPKFSQEYHSCSFLQKRSYGKNKGADLPESSTDRTLLQFEHGSEYVIVEDNRQQKCSNVNPSLPISDKEKLECQISTSSVKEGLRMQVGDSPSLKKEAQQEKKEQRFNLPPHVMGRNVGDPASDPTERKSPLQQPRIGVRVPYRNLTSQIVSSQEIVREILERSRVRSTAIAMAMNKRVADAVDRSFSKRLNASLARLPMPSGPEELEAALQASAGTKLRLLPQDKERNWHLGLPGVIGSSATTTVTTIKSSSSFAGSKSGTRSRSTARGAQGSGLYLEKEAEREIALRQLETLPTRCRSSRRQVESASATKVTKPKKLDWCKQRSRRKQSK